MGPDCTEDIPHECSVVRLVLVTSVILQVMSYGAIDIAMDENTLSPIVVAVLDSTVFEMLGHIQNSVVCAVFVIFNVDECIQCIQQMICIAGA
jgi:hypothetical protein